MVDAGITLNYAGLQSFNFVCNSKIFLSSITTLWSLDEPKMIGTRSYILIIIAHILPCRSLAGRQQQKQNKKKRVTLTISHVRVSRYARNTALPVSLRTSVTATSSATRPRGVRHLRGAPGGSGGIWGAGGGLTGPETRPQQHHISHLTFRGRTPRRHAEQPRQGKEKRTKQTRHI